MRTIDYVGTITIETCCSCGTVFGVESGLQRKLKENGNNFYCPNGHSQHYTYKEKMEDILAKKEARIKELECRVPVCQSDPIRRYCSYRFVKHLEKGGIKTIGDALNRGEVRLSFIYGVGNKCISEINEALEKHNIKLKP